MGFWLGLGVPTKTAGDVLGFDWCRLEIERFAERGKLVVVAGIMLLAFISETQHCRRRGVAACKPNLTECSGEVR